MKSYSYDTLFSALSILGLFIAIVSFESDPAPLVFNYNSSLAYLITSIAVAIGLIPTYKKQPCIVNIHLNSLHLVLFGIILMVNSLINYKTTTNLFYAYNVFFASGVYLLCLLNSRVLSWIPHLILAILTWAVLNSLAEMLNGEKPNWIFFNSTILSNFIALLLPFTGYYLHEKNRLVKRFGFVYWISFASLAGGMLIIAYSAARGAILSVMIALSIVLALNSENVKRRRLHYIITFFGTLIVIFIFYFSRIKLGSLEGRLFIWANLVETWKWENLDGIGIGNLRSYYSSLLKDFWRTENDTSDFYVADIVEFAFNDIIQLLVEGGLLSLIAYLLIIINSMRISVSSKNSDSAIILGVLIIYCFTSLFSYPLYSYYFNIIAVMMLALVNRLFKNDRPFISRKIRSYIANSFLAILSLIYLLLSIYIFHSYNCWKTMAQKNQTAEVFYFKTFPYLLRNDKDFQYFVSHELYITGDYQNAIKIMKGSGKMNESIDANILLGDSYFQLRDYEKAEYYFLTGQRYHPGKFKPKFYLFKLFSETSQKTKLLQLSEDIIRTPAKVKSKEIEFLKVNASKIISENNTSIQP